MKVSTILTGLQLREFEDAEKPCSVLENLNLGEVLLYTRDHRNSAKILGNINVFPNIIDR